MLNVAVINPSEGHSKRGIGFYVKNLFDEYNGEYFRKLINIKYFSSESEIKNNHNIDIVHYPYFELFRHSLTFGSRYKRIVTVHDVIPLKYPNIYKPGFRGKLNFLLQNLSLNNVNGIITDSYSSLVDIKKYLRTSDSKINLIPLAPANHFRQITNEKLLKSVSTKYNLKKEFVIYVGDINFNKNLNLLAKSCIKNNVNLVIVGKNASNIDNLDLNHPELNHLSELKDSIKNSDLIQTLGFVSDDELVCLYNLATITCMPSYSEGFGLSVIESLACGTPVICSNTSSLDEFVSESVFKFNPHSESELGELINKIFKDTSILKKLSPKALEYSRAFTWKKVAIDTYNAYKRYI